jgi:NAD(P)-dependent dehydrogenase (short-subunit alcohol dehydrogenase family)
MAWKLDGRTALITGAGSGIGAELARQLAARGMRLALIDVDADALEAVAAGLPGAQTAVADVRDRAGLGAAVEELAARCGGLDVCVANAGIATGGPLRLVGEAAFDETLDINLHGVWRTVRAALPHVLDRRGYVLLVASAAAVLPAAGLGAYSVSKAGVDALGRTLRVELRPHGVGVGVAYYLFLNTPMVAAGERSPVFARSKTKLPDVLGKTWPLEPAVARTVRAIERRSRAITYPPFLRGAVVLRGLLDNPLTDRVAGAGVTELDAAYAAEAERLGADAASRAVGGR